MSVSTNSKILSSFECRHHKSGQGRFFNRVKMAPKGIASFHGSSSLIFRFPPNFQRQLSIKARRNCNSIGVAQIVAASSSNNSAPGSQAVPEATAVDAASTTPVSIPPVDEVPVSGNGDLPALKEASFLSSDGSLTVHAGERLGRGIVTDAITTPVEKQQTSFEYGRYGNPTTVVLEEKISALEGAESTLIMASGMCASTVMFMALVPAGGHIVTTTNCYRMTMIFIETVLPKMGITSTVIDPADIEALETALDSNKVSLFFTESPTNPFLRCVDIDLVSKLCHSKGALVCIDGTFATPLNQKALALGADIVLHSATKVIGGHNDVLAGCISGPLKLVSEIRNLHHILGGTLNPVARVYYPGLPSHPEHELARKQMTGFGGVVSFEIDGDLMTTAKFIDALKIPYIAPSYGGCESIVVQPAIMSYWDLSPAERLKYGIKDNLVRLSVGVEDHEDIKSDILWALGTI